MRVVFIAFTSVCRSAPRVEVGSLIVTTNSAIGRLSILQAKMVIYLRKGVHETFLTVHNPNITPVYALLSFRWITSSFAIVRVMAAICSMSWFPLRTRRTSRARALLVLPRTFFQLISTGDFIAASSAPLEPPERLFLVLPPSREHCVHQREGSSSRVPEPSVCSQDRSSL